MFIQALLLVAVMVVISGSILMSTIVTARSALHQSLIAQSQAAMSDATADFVTWATDRVQRKNAEVSWRPIKDSNGKSDTSEFKPLCDSKRAASSTSGPCTHFVSANWMVVGATTPGGRPQAGAGNAMQRTQVNNLARTVDEQRIAAIVSVDVQSADGRHTFSSDSREITARIFDASPYVVVTGVRAVSAINGTIKTSEGDSGGYRGSKDDASVQSSPNPQYPTSVTDTRIVTTVNCVNTTSVNPGNPYNEAHNHIIEVGRDGDADWSYEMACTPTYRPTPAPVGVTGYLAPIGDTYATVDDNSSRSFARIAKGSTFPR